MQKGLLMTCPEYDDATAYLTYFSKEIINEAVEKSLKFKIVRDKNLKTEPFSKIINKLDYRLIVLNGHGSEDAVFGYKQNVIIQLNKNEHLLKERLVYARSCNVGAKLGKELMKATMNGAFIGYNLPFMFYMDSEWTAKPHNDKIAKLFIEPSNLIPISIIKGNSAIDAHNNAKMQILKIMGKLIKRKQSPETPFYLEALWNNYSGQVIYGNKIAKL